MYDKLKMRHKADNSVFFYHIFKKTNVLRLKKRQKITPSVFCRL